MAKRKAQTAAVVAAKSAKFKELGEARGNRCLNDIRLLGNLATGNYVHTAEQVNALLGPIYTELDRVRGLFAGNKENGPRITL